jgi:predicted ATPase/DNA-binding winged helix-turn-helix (wHTH) protein/tetratricopeptide (TPR) repeat protein
MFSFGPFVLYLPERRLEQEGRPVRLGGRAFDILTVLVERAPDIVSCRELLELVWPKIAINEAALRVHLTALRRALGDGRADLKYIGNVPGRGYFLRAPVSTLNKSGQPGGLGAATWTSLYLPPLVPRVLGRDFAIQKITELLTKNRLVTITGPGGIGKTTVAVAIARSNFKDLYEAVHFVDLAPIARANLAVSTIASSFGLAVQSDDPLRNLISFLKDRSLLLILDSCEHHLFELVVFIEEIFNHARSITILATSREGLHSSYEKLYPLSPLEFPTQNSKISANEVLAFPAARLFIERVQMEIHGFELSDHEAPLVANICHKLDGIALALELAAGRVSAFGIAGTARLLDETLALLWRGQPTAIPRHKTLSATLDWSHELLSESERIVMRRLSIFAGYFSLEAAEAVAAGEDVSRSDFLAAIASLIAKSLLSIKHSGTDTLYRMLDTTRSYGLEKLNISEEKHRISYLHAAYFLTFLKRNFPDNSEISCIIQKYSDIPNNIRAAVDWSFGDDLGEPLRAPLAAAAANLFIKLSLLSECFQLTTRGISTLESDYLGTWLEMQLQTLRGQSLMFISGNTEEVREALTRALDLAMLLNEPTYQLQLLGALHLFYERTGDYHNAHEFALKGEQVANVLGDQESIVAAHSLLGISFHLLGEQEKARTHIYKVLSYPRGPKTFNSIRFGFDQFIRARIALARTLWILGFPEQAVSEARSAIDEAENLDHPVTLCMALLWAMSVFLWVGDLAAVANCLDRFAEKAEAHSLTPYIAVALGVKGQLAIKRGDADSGIVFLQNAMASLQAARYALLTTDFMISAVEGLALTGNFDTALKMATEAIDLVHKEGNFVFLPELLRIKGELLAENFVHDSNNAEECFRNSRDLAIKQSALAWELRTATSLAKFKRKSVGTLEQSKSNAVGSGAN